MDETSKQSTTHYQAGRHLLSTHAREKAMEQFRAALALDPNHADSHAWLAVALGDSKRFPEAHAEADCAISLKPESAFYAWIKGIVLAGERRWKDAQVFFERAAQLAPNAANYHAHVARALYHQDQKTECDAAARRALQLDPEEQLALLYLGFVLLNFDRRAQARPHLERALELNPESSDAHNAMGLYFLHDRQTERALLHIREALRLNPHNAGAQCNLVNAMGAKNWFYGLFWRMSLSASRSSHPGPSGSASSNRGGANPLVFGIAFALIGGKFLRATLESTETNIFLPLAIAAVGSLLLLLLYVWSAPKLFRWWLKRKRAL